MTRTHRRVSIISLLEIFVQEVAHKDEWYSAEQLADLFDCSISSVRPALSWMRYNGYIVDCRRTPAMGCNVWNIRRGSLDAVAAKAKRTKAALRQTRKVLLSKSEE